MKNFKDILITVSVFFIVGSVVHKMIHRAMTDHMLKTNSIIIKAVVIGEKNYEPNSPVKPEYSLSYMFNVNGTEYKNNTHDKNLKIGDSVEIEFVKGSPGMSKPLHPKE